MIALTKRSLKDAKKISRSGLKSEGEKLIEILKINPDQNPPSYEKLTKYQEKFPPINSQKIPKF